LLQADTLPHQQSNTINTLLEKKACFRTPRSGRKTVTGAPAISFSLPNCLQIADSFTSHFTSPELDQAFVSVTSFSGLKLKCLFITFFGFELTKTLQILRLEVTWMALTNNTYGHMVCNFDSSDKISKGQDFCVSFWSSNSYQLMGF